MLEIKLNIIMGDDDFWNESQVKSSAKFFSFDDQENASGIGDSSLQMCGISLDGTAQLFQQLQAGLRQTDSDTSSVTSEIKHGSQFELYELISERALNCIMESDSPQYPAQSTDLTPAEEVRILRRQIEEMWTTPDPKKTVKKMMLKLPFMLEQFRSLQSKKRLLEEAITMGDGDTILAVVIFLSRTLKKTYLNQILLEHPAAATHYVAYLTTRRRTSELTDLLEMLGKSKHASMKQLESITQQGQPQQRQLQRLVACAKNHSFDTRDAQILDRYIKFIEWQNESGVCEDSVVDCLAVLCEQHWSSTRSPVSPHHLVQLERVSEKQYQWTAITARAKHHAWQDIQAFLTTKSWLRGPKMRISLPLEHVINVLHANGAPQDTLYAFLQLIDTPEKRLPLARLVACDKAIIEASMLLKDNKTTLSSFRPSMSTS